MCITYRREDCGVADIDISTVTCEGVTATRGRIDGDALVVKFNRQDLGAVLVI